MTKAIFVGRQTELEHFSQVIGTTGKLERVFWRPGRRVKKPRLFLPHGIGGIGKTSLSQRCLALAKEQGWQTLAIDWEKVDNRPSAPLDLMNVIALALRAHGGDKVIKPYLDERSQAEVVQARVQRYQAEHPEEWQKLLEAARKSPAVMPTLETKALAVGATLMMDVGPKAMAKAYDMLLDKMVENKTLKDKHEALLFKEGDFQLARRLVQAITTLAGQNGLVLLFDTCEVLSLSLEEFLRDMIVCPGLEQGTGLVVIVSGRFSQYREREFEDEEGQRKQTKGYADRLSDPPPTNWDLSLFADPEVNEYLAACGLTATPELVAYVQGLARGVPFAVQLVAEAVEKLGPEKVRQEFPPVDPAAYSPQEMVTLVTRRFLRYCLDNGQDEERLRALAMLRRRDDEALRVLWQLPDAEKPRQRLVELEARYGFMQRDGTMHEVVRQFLRDSLRGDDRETAARLGRLLSQHYKQQWQAETDRAGTLADLLAEERWRMLTLDYLNALCWQDEETAIAFLAQRCLEALVFRSRFALGLLKLAVEFRQADGWWRSQSGRHFDTVSQAVTAQGPAAVAALRRLGQAKEGLKLERGHECLLWLAQAGQTAQLETALTLCLQAEKLLPADDSMRQVMAQMFGIIGSGLGFPGGKGIASPLAKQAYERAVHLAPEQAAYCNGLGAMLFIMAEPDHLSLAQVYFTQAITLDPNYATAYYNRGNTYHELGDYPAAVADYSQAITLDPNDATAYYNRGLTYHELGEYPAAVADYSQAITLDPNLAQAYSNRGNTYAKLGEYPAAVADYSQAITLDPNYATAYYNRGLTYHELGDYPAAVADYSQAMQLDSDYSTPVFNTACAYALMGEVEQACHWLRRAILMNREYLEMAHSDSDFDGIREQPVFQALLQEPGGDMET